MGVALDQDLPSTFGGLAVRLNQAGETLDLHGRALVKLGPAAPPCLVEPFLEYRQRAQEALSALMSAFRSERGDEAYEKFSEASDTLTLLIDGIPQPTQSWTDAPAVWRPETFAEERIVVVERGAIGGLGQEGENTIRLMLDRTLPKGSLPPVLAATENVGGSWIWRGLGNAGRGIWGFAKKRFIPLWIAYEVLDELGITDTVWGWISPPPPEGTPSLRWDVSRFLDDFEEDYLPRVAQQWQAVIKIARVSGGNPKVMLEYMAKYDPRIEQRVPPLRSDFDVVALSELAGVESDDPHGRPPSAAGLMFLLGGSAASVAYLGSEG